ncbi:MAG: SdrD B-like domain-containing protein, partial [Bacteroidota bacterium]
FPSENAVQLVDPLGAVVATVISPGGRSYSATVSVGCQSDGAGYTLVLTDSQNDGWDGFGPFVRVEDINGNVLLSNVTLPSGQSPLTTSGFTVSGGGAACPTCSDGSQNGNETGVDCGGPDCSPCSTCFDGMQNGNETGVDCGGPDCRACVGPNDICVNVFNDYNSNGAWDGNGELGITGITVTAYDAANTASVFTSSSDGNYVFTPGNADTYRVEVTGIPSDLEPSVAGATTVFFIDRGNKVDVGLHRPAEHFLSSEVIVAVPCYVDGALNGANANEDVLVLSPADDLAPGVGNQSPTEYFIANHNQIGSTFGVAYSRAANSLLSAAFTKRHTAFGPSGTGAIYKIDLNGDRLTQPISSTGVSTLVDLNSLFGANTAGANPHPDAGTDFERDPATYDAVGKIGLGGLAMSETENVLWTINLADRRLYEIPLGGTRENPTAPAAGDISRWPATGDLTGLPGIMGTDLSTNIRPFAVKCYRGDIYIGLVYTAESTVVFNAGTSEVSNLGDRSLLRGYIYKFDPDTDSFSQLLSFPLDYVRGQAVDFCGNNGQAEFYPWTPVYDATAFTTATMGTSRTTTTFPAERVYPQPWITDIEFDEEGKMLIGLRDRFADQHGFNKLPPNAAAASDPNTPFTADGAGDVLVATINTLDNTTYVLENNAQNGTNGGPFGPSAGAGFQEGPGGGEFFFDDRYRPSNAGPDGFLAAPCGEDPAIDEDPLLDPQLQQGHDEITLGGLFVYQGHCPW